MLPDEYMKVSLVEVWPDSPLTLSEGFSGREVSTGAAELGAEEMRPKFYIVVMRRLELQWHCEILQAQPLEGGQVPHEVLERMVQMRQRIMAEQRSDRGKNAYIARKAHEDQDDEMYNETRPEVY